MLWMARNVGACVTGDRYKTKTEDPFKIVLKSIKKGSNMILTEA